MPDILEIKNLTKIYPGGVLANYNISFSVREGEIHALVGENGAGKSTLMKMLFGMEEITDGEIYFKGKKVNFSSSKEAIENGIGMVHQHFMLVPSLTVAENLTLGVEKHKGILVDKKQCIRDTEEIAKKYGFRIDAGKKVRDIGIEMKQKLEILKVLYRGAKVIILDEPTAVLTPQETEELFEQLLNLKKQGFTIIFISHKLNEVKYLCDRLTVLKSGRSIGTYDVDALSEEEISRLMVGRDVTLKYQKKELSPKEVRLKVEDIAYTDRFGTKILDGVSFKLKDSEILGIAGVEGNGPSEIIEVIAGLINADSGKVYFKDKDITNASIAERRKSGIAHVAEDRMTTGCAPELTVQENVISVTVDDFAGKAGILNQKQVRDYTDMLINDFKVKTKDGKQKLKALSGGNIQKAIVAREFQTESDVLLINQPTRGVDVGAIELIHQKVLEKREQGKAILLVSADLSELIGLSDRILVFYKGKIVGHVKDVSKITEQDLGLYMLGLKQDSAEELKEVF